MSELEGIMTPVNPVPELTHKDFEDARKQRSGADMQRSDEEIIVEAARWWVGLEDHEKRALLGKLISLASDALQQRERTRRRVGEERT